MNSLTHRVDNVDISYRHAYWDGCFTDEELTKIESYCDSQDLESATVNITENPLNLELRDSKTAFVYINHENEWIFERLLLLAERVNSEFFHYDLTGFDHFQYTVYDSPGTKYDFHTDLKMDKGNNLNTMRRKLSFSLLLNNKLEFTGGELEFYVRNDFYKQAEQKRGRAIAFPAYQLHRVAPIKSGVRKSLVFWVVGPKFK